MSEDRTDRIETRAVHAASRVDPATGAIAPVLVRSSTFQRDEDGSFPRGYQYGRDGNPNRDAFEHAVADLEGGRAGVAFASGNAASTAILQLAAGGHIVTGDEGYMGTRKILQELTEPLGIRYSQVDTSDGQAVSDAIRDDTRLVWIETPANPSLRISDIADLAQRAHARGALLVCDNTFASPVLQRPIEHGADLVMHSATKYLGGHSDLIAGIVISADEGDTLARLRRYQTLGGAVPSPADCWLLQRSLQTLALRVGRATENATALASILVGHPEVLEVMHPSLPSHPGHALASRQMDGPGAMLSFRVRGGRERAIAVVAAARLFVRATSLGGVESLIEHRASIEGEGTPVPDDLIRLSVGIEHVDDLAADLRAAIEH